MLTADTNILLTGATGLIGGELLRRLLVLEVGRVYCLVRPGAGHGPRARLVQRLAESESGPGGGRGMLTALAGDVALPQFGLADREAQQVMESVDLIIHCASELSFIRDAHCRRTNVTGMHNLIGLAQRCRRRPLIVHLSTAAACGAVTHRCLAEDDGSDPDNRHHNEYTHSKAVAERVLREAGLPCLILRPSITLSAGLGARKFAQAIAWFLPLMCEFEALPIDPASRVDVVPVDFVAEAIVGLLGKRRLQWDCYNISAGPEAAMLCGEVFTFTDEFYGRAEPLQLIPPRAWTLQLHRRYVGTPQRRRLFAILRYYLPFLNMDVVYDHTRLRTELGEAAMNIRPVTSYCGDLLRLLPAQESVDGAVKV